MSDALSRYRVPPEVLSAPVARPRSSVWDLRSRALQLLLVSYFYCLPLLSTGNIGGLYSEVRLYDLVFIGIAFFLVLPQLGRFFQNWARRSPAHSWLLAFVVLCGVSLILTVTLGGFSRLLIALVRYFRLFSYCAVFVLVLMWIRDRRQLNTLLDTFVGCAGIVSVISVLQSLNVIGNLWHEGYKIYWSLTAPPPVATLAPNHSHISLVMSLSIIAVIMRLKTEPFTGRSLLRASLLIPMSHAMIASQGRSGWLCLAVYGAASMIFSSRRLLLPAVGLVLAAFWLIGPGSARTGDLTEILRTRAVTSVAGGERDISDLLDPDAGQSLLERIDNDRYAMYRAVVERIVTRPELVMFGVGYQNAPYALKGIAIAAHNGYLNVLVEVGIIGLLVYLGWIYQMFRVALWRRKIGATVEARIFAAEWLALFCGVLVANIFADVIYAQRALFSFLGSFMFLTALCLHPGWDRLVPGRSAAEPAQPAEPAPPPRPPRPPREALPTR